MKNKVTSDAREVNKVTSDKSDAREVNKVTSDTSDAREVTSDDVSKIKVGSYLSKRGYVLIKQSIPMEELKLLKKELRAKPLQDDKYLFGNNQDNSFPIYIETKNKFYMPKVYGLKRYGQPEKVMTNYIGQDWENDIEFTGVLYPIQIEATDKLLESLYSNDSSGGILSLGTGFGKCHAYDTPILMYNGSIKLVQDIIEGDLLMGDDSTPRKVLSLARGQDEMYDIIPVKGEKYTVNQEHILCLKNTKKNPWVEIRIQNKITRYDVKWWQNNKENSKVCNTIKETNEFIEKIKNVHQDIVEISVKNYLKQTKTFKHHFKSYRVSIQFPEKELPIDPYMIGYWLGDGTSKNSNISTQDASILYYFAKNLSQYNLFLDLISKYDYKISSGYGQKNNLFLQTLKDLKLINNKHIPMIYKCNSRENRLKLLAGLLDSDGYLTHDKCCFDFIQKNERLLDDIIYLCRSLGFACYKSKQKKGCWYKGEYKNGDYFRITISGNNIHEIPTLCPRKKPHKRTQIKDVLVTGITVKHIGRGNYYGFTLDGNNRYVIGDFTVTHNTISALYVLSKLKKKTIVVVNKIPLMKQWESEIKRFLPGAQIGFIQGQKNVSVEGKDIVLAMLQSLARIDYPDSLFSEFSCVTVDECFPYETNIITSQGNIRIGRLYYLQQSGKPLPSVKTFNETTGSFEFKNIVNVFRKQNDTLIEISCSKMKIRSTENHRYLTKNGWKEAIQLTTDDYLISNYDKITINSVCPALNDDQYQIVLGSYLGDGHIQLLKNGRVRLSVIHCEAQKEYCKWKASMFDVNVKYMQQNGYSQKPACKFATKTFYIFNQLPNKKTSIPQWVLDEIDERGLAIWFMDDGSMSKSNFYSTISTDSFDEDSQKRIVLKLKSMGIDCTYTMYKKHYYNIVINKSGTIQLIRLIHKYVHKDMLYKILPGIYKRYIHDMSINTIDNNTIFYKRQNIKKELLVENKIYNVYNNADITKSYRIKYKFCKKCNINTFHHITYYKTSEYYKCNHIKNDDNLNDMPLKFSYYNWCDTFLNYGYAKITKITTNIKNYKQSIFKKNYVFDMEIQDNHNYIVKNGSFTHSESGFVVHNCHNLSSRVFSQVLSKLCAKYTIGLSATPTRSDGCEYVFKYHIGDIVYKSDSKRKGLPPIIRYLQINSEDYKEISVVNRITGQNQIQFTSMLSDLVEMPKRNKLILELIKGCIKENRKILVLSDRRNHVIGIQKALDNDPSVTFTYGLFLGQMKITELEKSKASDVILATYSAFGEGVSEKDLDTLILITPKKFIGHLKNSVKNESGKLEQIVGRIFRKEHVSKHPMIIDLQDHFSVYKTQSAQRRTFYKQNFKTAVIETQSINLDDFDIQDITIECITTKKKKQILQEQDDQNAQENLDKLLSHCVIEE